MALSTQYLIPSNQYLLSLFVALAAALLLPAPARAQAGLDEEIVYVDQGGFIRVYDPRSSTGGTEVTWFSPLDKPGYTRIVAADFNGDGDAEIAGVRRAGAAGVLDVYDPVVVSGPFDPGQIIGGIPWAHLASIPLPDTPALVVAGDLDAASPGVELLVSYGDDFTADPTRPIPDQSFLLFRQVGTPDGRAWQAAVLPLAARAWTAIAAGQLDLRNNEEVALVSSPEGVLAIYRILGNSGNYTVQLLYENASGSRPWNWAAIGRWRNEPGLQVGAVRDVRDPPPAALPSFLVFDYSASHDPPIIDSFAESFAPAPHFVFFADLNADGYDEAVMLRDVETGNQPRLFTRWRSGAFIESNLGGSNTFEAGAGGDVDGDGKDEIVIISETVMRTFVGPDLSETATDFLPPQRTDALNIAIADLDRLGVVQEITLIGTPQTISATIPAGAPAHIFAVSVTTDPPGTIVPFAWALAGDHAWVSVEANSSVTPAVLTVRLDATGLEPGTYTERLLLTSSEPMVLTQPVIVEIELTVTPGLYFDPASLVFVLYPCVLPPTGVQTQTVQVVSAGSLNYTASILDAPDAQAAGGAAPDAEWPSSVPWAKASSSGTAPDTLTVTVDFALWEPTATNSDTAHLIAVATLPDHTVLVRRLPITLVCAQYGSLLPLISR